MPLTQVVAPVGRRRYRALMPAALWKLLAALALVMMPFGMSPASAAPADHADHMAASMAEHCGDQRQQPDHKAAHCCDCAVACSALLPDVVRWSEPSQRQSAGRIVALHSALADALPETATPPPRRS